MRLPKIELPCHDIPTRTALALSASIALVALVAGCGGTDGGGPGGAGAGDDGGIAGNQSIDGGSAVGAEGGTGPGSPTPDSGPGTGPQGSDAGATHDGDSGAGHADAGSSESDAGGGSLNPKSPPGSNFDLALWELQLPIGSQGAPTTLSPAQLTAGFTDAYFFTDPTDGSMSFWDPENGVTTADSNYPRSELREMTAAGKDANWAPTGTNTLSATVKVTQVPLKVVVGQIHLGTGTPSSTKPLLEIYYYPSGKITIGIEQTPAGGNEVETQVGSAPLGTKFSYVLGLAGNDITIAIDGAAPHSFTMPSSFDQEGMYFKAGDYDQSVGSSATVGAKVQFYALQISHAP